MLAKILSTISGVVGLFSGWWLYAVAGVAGLAAGAALGWRVESWRAEAQVAQAQAEQAATLAAISNEAAAAATHNQQELQDLQGRIATLDASHLQELNNARAENDRLRADVAAGTRRLSVCAACPAPAGGSATGAPAGAAGVDHATARADIDRRDAAALLAIVGRGDAAIRQLSACQAYVKTILAAQAAP